MKLALTIPGFGNIEPTILPKGIQTGGLSGSGEIIISVLIQALIIGALGFALFMLARAGFNMITSGGDKEKFTQGRERLRYSIIGLLIIFFSFFIINFFGNLFGIELIKRPPPTPSAICTNANGIYCNNSCYDKAYIDKNYPAPLCGAECTTKGGVTGLYGKVCPDTFSGCAGPGQSCDASVCCSSQGLVCDDNTSLCVTPTPQPILTSGPTPILNPLLTPQPASQLTPPSGPTPTPTFLMAGQIQTCSLNVTNRTKSPIKMAIDLDFKGGNSSNVKVEIRVPSLSEKIFQEGEAISFPLGTTIATAIMTVRPGASPTCFDNITCKLFSAESGSKGNSIDESTLGQNTCIEDTLTTFFQSHRFPEVGGNRTVFSDLLLFNTAPVEQKASFAIGSGCFSTSQRQFFINNKEIFPGNIQTIPGNGGRIGISMQSILPFGTTPVPTGTTPTFNCPVTIQRVLE